MSDTDGHETAYHDSPRSSTSAESYHDDPVASHQQPDGYRDEEAMVMAPRQPPPAAPPPTVSKPVVFRLYVSHFLSTWNSRLFEFGAVLFLASIYPDTLMPMSVYALVRGAAAVVLSPSLGSCIDRGNRLSVVRVSIVGQRLAVAMSCGIFLALERLGDLHDDLQSGLFAMVVGLACVEKLCSVMNLVSVERDWVVVITKGNEQARQDLNARIRRIDLFCKLVGPLAISLVDGASTTMAIWVTLGMTLLSVVTEYLCIARVYQLVPALAQLRSPPPPPPPQQQTSSADATDTQDDTRCPPNWLKSKIQAVFPVSAVPFYFSHPALLPSFSLALLYFTVLSFSGQMMTFLLSVGYNSFHIGAARTVSTLFELGATWAAPKLTSKIGPVRAGIWSLSWQMTWLAAGVGWFLSDASSGSGTSSAGAVGGLVSGVVLSRVGLWGYDLSAQTIIQGQVDVQHRGAFSTVEASVQSVFELLSYAATVVFSRPEQFRWPVLMSVGAVYAAGGLYASYVRKKRGHLFHAPPCLHCNKEES
ncbi:Solute carrier family 40 member 1 [Colletotrichum trifolii]|uniref:Solute carrier family 40 member n=1 Tax=Colletotrichum trifolii TaxID=5466 RepID=A0A4R8QNI2_COLTR|nr:Solute carrier family 40 member 1 [Colletotrichum trifolii]